ncbi:MAG: protein kinase [Defluviitaleaceae bacterium]|nr:protein kinase [Defluviitaleaceae bacterium]
MSDIKTYEPLWGSWHVDSIIGEGSFGKVYKVRKEEFGRTYYSAVKIISIPQNEADLRLIRDEGLDDASVKSYFHAFVTDIIQEIDLMSAFRGNSHIVSFEDHKVIERADEIGWDILIRMELLTSLSQRVMEKPLTTDDVIKLGIDICRALELCALKNTIHRDIKPDNIFVSEYGDYKLGDFGIARQIERTSSGLSKKGTYTYMAPEVFKGDEYGASVDIYSLGLVMYRYLNQGRTPFLPDFPAPITPRERDEALARRMRGEALPGIKGVDPRLNDIVMKACAFERKNRFDMPSDMRDSLEALANRKNLRPMITPISYVTHETKMPETANEDSGIEKTEGIFDSPFVMPNKLELSEQIIAAESAFNDGDAVQGIQADFFESDEWRRIKTNAATLSTFFLGYKGIGDLTPLSSYKELSVLYLHNNHISDLRPLSSMAKVEILNLNNNEISYLRPLASMASLMRLFLEHNQITDVTPLASMTNLVWLNLAYNQITDLAPLGVLKNLLWLTLSKGEQSQIQINNLRKALPNCYIKFC